MGKNGCYICHFAKARKTLGALKQRLRTNAEVMALLERFYDPSSGVVQAVCWSCEMLELWKIRWIYDDLPSGYLT